MGYLFAIIERAAVEERKKISKRAVLSLARVRAQSKELGRPKKLLS